jgi:hypothetical protein
MSEVPGHLLKDWNVTVSIDESGGQTRAKARLRWRDQEAVGVGLARLGPTDRYHAHIGDELAVARALADLARRMMAGTVQNIEGFQQPAATPR